MIVALFMDVGINTFLVCRSLVSASQDGKLIVWDSHTTNKVQRQFLFQLVKQIWPHIFHYGGVQR